MHTQQTPRTFARIVTDFFPFGRNVIVAQPPAPCLASRVDPEAVCQSDNLACNLLLSQQQQNGNITATIPFPKPFFDLRQPPTSDGSPNGSRSRATSPTVVSGGLPDGARALCDLKEMDLMMQCRIMVSLCTMRLEGDGFSDAVSHKARRNKRKSRQWRKGSTAAAATLSAPSTSLQSFTKILVPAATSTKKSTTVAAPLPSSTPCNLTEILSKTWRCL
ncbi:hypothetical protein DVH24_007800 [Malus domestica]|uniref:Uncharacterized protein n=1 Tax=Malus domestica TaxID=3750 RepID=A0A498JUG4_MALDO|nr:hypothetical protein DVH24_007800 [Malus domestica]